MDEPTSPRWLSDLVKDDISISFPHHQYEMMLQSLDDYTLSDLNKNIHNNNNSSFSPKISSTDMGSSTTTTRPARNLDKSPSISSTSSKMISFGAGAADAEVKPPPKQDHEELVSTKNMINCNDSEHNYQTTTSKGKQLAGISNNNGGRSPFYGQEHVVAERKRREKINQRLIALSAVLPHLKKMDKASVLGEATKYVEHLQERIKTLEAEVANKTVGSVVVKKPYLLSQDHNSSSSSHDETSGFQTSLDSGPEIEARVSQKHVLIRVHCERRPGCTAKILDLIEQMKLSVVNNSVISFGSSLLDITVVAQMEVEFSMTIEELVKNLRRDLLNFMQ